MTKIIKAVADMTVEEKGAGFKADYEALIAKWGMGLQPQMTIGMVELAPEVKAELNEDPTTK